jgi:PAS domain S-box-containing protein
MKHAILWRHIVAEPRDNRTLEETIAQLEATLESTHDGILVLDLERRVTRFNRQFIEMFQFTPEIVERRDVDEMRDFVAEQLEEPEAVRLRSPELFETISPTYLERLRFKDGRVFDRYVSPQRIGSRIVGRVISFRNVSQSVRTEQALEQHRAFLEKAQEVAHVGSWVAELDGSDRLGWSTETHRIFGVPLGEFEGTSETFFGFVHADDRDAVRGASAASKRGDKPYDVEHRIVTGGGAVRWVHEKADLVCDSDGRPARMVGTVQDITERRHLEEQLRHAQKLDALGRLAGGIAHDLNNALTAIAGYAELALNALRPEHPARADVHEIRRASERAASVTRQLLAFSRKQILEPRVFNLNQAVGDLARLLERLLGDNIELDTVLEPSLPAIHADPGQIEQAIINLAVNARDAMPDGGRLQLATSLERVSDRAPGAHEMPPGSYVTLTVSDTGHGMTPETQAKIFEPFFTTKPQGKGTGLGLSMVWGTVKQSGGFIFVESEPGRGTMLRLHFPAAAGQEAAHRSRAADASHSGATLLVVDDEDGVRALVAATLAHDGYRVVQAASADEALGLIGSGLSIDLLLTDAIMPGTSGIQLVHTLLADHPRLPVVVMSGYTEEMTTPGGLPAPVSILAKPFSPIELRRRVRETLDRRGGPIRIPE